MVQGVIQRINDKQWNGKTFWSFALQGQDGWFNTGMKRPPAVGTSVEFNEKTNSKGYKEVDGTITIRSDGPVQVASIPTSVGNNGTAKATPSYGAGGSAAYWDRKEARDIANDTARELGASRNTAIAIIDLALKHEVIKLPAAAKREEFLWTLLDKYTNKLMGKDSGSGSADKSNDSGSTEKATGGTTEEPTAATDDNWN